MDESVGKSETWILNPAEGYLIPKARGGVSLTPIYSFFEGGFSRERVKPSFLWHLALYHSFITFFWKLHWNSSSRSDDMNYFCQCFGFLSPGLLGVKTKKGPDLLFAWSFLDRKIWVPDRVTKWEFILIFDTNVQFHTKLSWMQQNWKQYLPLYMLENWLPWTSW